MFKARTHAHPRNKDVSQYGHELEPGETVDGEDVYPDASGGWKKCGRELHGFRAEVLKHLSPIIRPVASPTAE